MILFIVRQISVLLVFVKKKKFKKKTTWEEDLGVAIRLFFKIAQQ